MSARPQNYMRYPKCSHSPLPAGQVGEAGGHDWIYLFSSLGLLPKAQLIGGLTHKLGTLVVLPALGWAGGLLRRQYPRVDGHVRQED